jgi:predicted aldo/keto reductase-like oxidoreductase
MLYRTLGKTGLRVSVLGFGAMRLPFEDEARSVAIIRRALDLGVNYVDTAYGYGNQRSESIVGQALRGCRDRVVVATKLPMWDVATTGDYRRFLERQLARLGTDTVDLYLFHSLNQEHFEQKVLGLGLLAEAQRAKQEGLVRHIGFSFHDQPETMKRIIDTGTVEMVLCQYNLLDRSNHEAMRYAHEQGLGVVVMGPVGGGRLGEPSRTIQAMLPASRASTPELALRFVLSNEHVSSVLSGMGSEQMVDENVGLASRPCRLTEEELDQIERAAAENARLADLYCTDCKYCMPCPHDVNIPLNFRLMNLHRVYDVTEYARSEYPKIGTVPWLPGKRADACTECGECEEKCPQKIPIREQLQETARTLGQKIID